MIPRALAIIYSEAMTRIVDASDIHVSDAIREKPQAGW
jgi:hypothetical protein